LDHIGQAVEVFLYFLDLVFTEFTVAHEFFGEAQIIAIDVLVGTFAAKDFAAKSTMMLSPEERKLFGTALAPDALLILQPVLSWTQS